MKVWLIRLESLTGGGDRVVSYGTKEEVLNDLREWYLSYSRRHARSSTTFSASSGRIKGIYEVNLELKTIQEYALVLENVKLTLRKKG
ncbi:hypothetical protein [Paenibacillus larvae]|uniref:hypothetical protein n=1 Tax=Paenibacillus larvae TaxID=1464 RepID=UPI00016957C7|nr:hypothetical protein [Paenibacillus larvae]ETK27401.1 hypothetical protein ERIC1_1c08460 [Paenibacillus larvae subsp. larvae DSM 25719]MDT2268151.1 hypothetical protein [Paenibacillus larvae]MDT2277875.1 hypothetical protein [Paenibacillus larvae]MDT2288963.1 hypothetical protein [Paenibacillus larvae]MDT2306305.1 hypothetical protein [Paenibacillus larvae]